MAPFTPFIAEEIYKNLTGNESVHLADFPVADDDLINQKLNENMAEVRTFVNTGLKLRAEAGIKVRQPLRSLCITDVILDDELVKILEEEVNVKEIICNKNCDAVRLDTAIDEALKLEGQAREVIRAVQEMRKEAGYEVDNRIKVCYVGGSEVFEKFGELIQKEVLANELVSGKIEQADLEKVLKIDEEEITISIKK